MGDGFAAGLTASVSTVFMLGRGLSYGQIGAVWTVSLAFNCLLNVPTGAWADRSGRRLVNAIGLIGVGLGEVAYGLSRTPAQFYLAAAVFGLGAATAGGSLQAWLVDAQIARGARDKVPQILANVQALTSLAGIAAGLGVGLFFSGPLERLYFLSGALMVGIGAALILLLEENRGAPARRLSAIRESISFYVRCRPLWMLTGALAAVYAGYTAFVFTWQPKALAAGWAPARLGYLYAVYLAFAAGGSYLAGWLARRPARFNAALIVSLAVAAAGLAVEVAGRTAAVVVAGIATFAIGYGAFIPTVMSWTNEFVPTRMRAAVLSVMNMTTLSSVALLQTVMGRAIDAWGFAAAVGIGCGLAILGAAVLVACSRARWLKVAPERGESECEASWRT